MSTFCITGEKNNVDAAVSMLKRLIAEGNSELLVAGAVGGNNNNHNHGNNVGNGSVNGAISNMTNGINGNLNGHLDRRGSGVGGVGVRGPGGEFGHRLGRVGSDMSRSDGSPTTAPCRWVG